MKKIIVALVVILGCCASLPAGAYVYENPAPQSGSSFTVGEGVSLAKQFTLTQASAIEAIAVYFSATDPTAEYYLNLYNKPLQDVNGYLRLDGLFKSYDFTSGGSDGGWYGVSNLANLVLGPGTYWLEIGATTGSGDVATGDTGATSGTVVTTDTSTGNATDSSETLDLGVHLSGESLTTDSPTAAPEPGTLVLASVGLAGALAWGLRRKR